MRTRFEGKLLLLFLLSFAAVMLFFPAIALAQNADGSTDPATANPAPVDPAPTGPTPTDPATADPGAQAPAPAPTIRSDKADYAPGESVTLTGSGWRPGESVNILINDDQRQTWNRNVDVTADAGGKITDRFVLPEWFVATYKVTATGAQSGVATTSFTDGNVRVLSSGPTFNLSWRQFNSNTACSGTPTANGSGTAIAQNNGTFQKDVDAGQSLEVTAPLTAGSQSFSNWSGAGTPNNRTLCIAGTTGTQTATANYAAAVNTALSVNAASGTFGGSANLSATLTAGGSGVGNKAVTFILPGSAAGTATTNASGVATVTNASLAGISAGTYLNGVEARFAGDAGYNASNGSGNLTVAKADQTIAFAPLVNKTFGDQDFRVSATADSGLPVTFTSSTTGTCTVAGDTVHIAGMGVCTITASQDGNANHKPAAPVSQSFSIGKGSQTINFAAPTGKSFGDTDFDPGATASSGLAVAYTSSTEKVCAIVGGKIRIVSAGTCIVTASQAGNANYNPADNVTRSFEIAKARADVTLSNLTPSYDGSAKSVGVSTSPQDLIVDVKYYSDAQYQNLLTNPTDAGTYHVVATVDDSNYRGGATGTLVIGKAAATIALNNLNHTYDGSAKSAAASTTPSGLNVQISYSRNDRPVANPTDAGSYAVTARVADDPNYEGTRAGTLVIGKAQLSVNAKDQSTVYGDDNLAPSYELSGFVNGETRASANLSGEASCSIATSAPDAGVYDDKIECTTGTLSAPNYGFAAGTKGKLTITPRPITVTADHKTKTYGDDDPRLTYDVTSGNLVGNDSLSGSLERAAGESVAGSPYAITRGTLSAGDNYDLAFVGANLTINKAPLAVKADDKSRAYGDANPDFTGTIEGVKNGDDITGRFSSAATASSGVGGYPIVADASGADAVLANYAITKQDGTLTIGKADLAVTAEDRDKVYGAALNADDFSGTVVGIKNGDAIAAGYSSDGAAATSGVGDYAIVPTINATDAVLANYNRPVLNNGTLTVTKADLTVTADDRSREYGEANPDFTGTLTGLKNGDNITASYGTDAARGSDVGAYDIVPSLNDPNDKLGNYDVVTNSGSLTVTKATLAVKADDKSKTYGDANPTFTASYDGFKNGDAEEILSGNPALSTTATQSSDLGTYAITAAAGDLAARNYAFAFREGTLTINKRALEVTADDKNKTYGEDDPTLTYSVTSGNLVNADGFRGSLEREAGQDVGAYAIGQGTLSAGGNYEVTFVPGTLRIGKAPLTVTAESESKAYGDTNPRFVASYEGFVNGDTQDSLSGTLAFGTNADASSPVGSYDVTPSGLTSGNYEISFIKGTLRVNSATLTVTAGDATKVYGDANPAFAARYSGFKNGDDEDDLGGTLDFETGATAASAVGTYAITPSGLSSSNYEIEFVDGTLTIDKADLTVTTKDATKTYGDPNPDFEAGYSGFVNGDDEDDLGGTLAFDTRADRASPVGTYDVKPEGLTSANYEISFANGTLTVSKATPRVSITWENVTYDGSVHPAAALVSGVGEPAQDLGEANGFAYFPGTDASGAALSGAPRDAGTYTVRASFGGNSNYTAASATKTIAIGKAETTTTVGCDAGPFTYKGSAYTPCSARVSGPGGLDQEVTPVTYENNTNAGTATARASYAESANYEESQGSENFTISKKALTITAQNRTITYGEALPANGVTYDGFVDGEDETTAGVLGGEPRYNYSRNSNPVDGPQNAGTYAIVPSGLTSANYEISFANGTLTIGKSDAAKVTIDWSDSTYDGSANAASATASGVGTPAENLGGVDNLAYFPGTDASGAALSGAPRDAGTYTVRASFGGNSNYTAASATKTIAIGKAASTTTVSCQAGPFAYTGSAQTPCLATVTGPGGLDLTPQISYENNTNAGTATARASYAESANHKASNDSKSFAIAKAPLTVKADNKEKVYGAANPQFTGTLAGVKNNDGITASYGTDAAQSSPVGSYPIAPSLDDPNDKLANYSVNSTNGTLTVTKAPLTITANDATKTYGDPNPDFSVRYSGFVLGQDRSVLGGEPRYTTTPQADGGSKAGTYAITPSGLTSGNYGIAFQNGTLKIEKRQATVVYTGQNYATLPSAGNATINLSAKVSRSGTLGDLARAKVQFTVKKFGGSVQTTASAMADASGNAATTASVPTSDDPYTVEVRIDPANEYWTSGTDVSSLQVIVGSGTGRTAGGGWIPDAANNINGKSNFGFTVQNSKTGIKGNSLFIYRVREGNDEVQYVVKSNSWQGGALTFNVNNDPTRATFTGKATVQRYVNGVFDSAFSGGNHTFTVDDFDGDLKTPRVTDGYAIVVRNSSNQIVKQLGSRTAPVTLGGGNVLIQRAQ